MEGSCYLDMETETASREGDGEKQYAVVWDFDWTLINENSDTFIVDRISHDARLNEGSKRMGWTQPMDHMMQKLQPSRDRLRSHVGNSILFGNCK